MQRIRLERMPISNIIKEIEMCFKIIPAVPRDCIRALNMLVYNMQKHEFDSCNFKEVVFLILRGLTASDLYLRNYIYTVLIELGRKTPDGILAINYIIKELDDRKIPVNMKNTALRALFANLPLTMHFDFQKYVQAGILDKNENSIAVAAEFFKNAKVDLSVKKRISDYHLAYFGRVPINKYTSMIEMERLVSNNSDEVSSYLFISTDQITFVEAARQLTLMRPESAAPHIEKAVHVAREMLVRGGVYALAALRILGSFCSNFPTKVAYANHEIEDLVHNPCRILSMLAILILLRTGTEKTVDMLALKLEPYLQSMPNNYKRMAINTMEKLSLKKNSNSYFTFLKSILIEKGDLEFKRFILQKIEILLKNNSENNNLKNNLKDINNSENNNNVENNTFNINDTNNSNTFNNSKDITDFLCNYLEDPEYFQLNIDILGILGKYMIDKNNLVHIYNRLILENGHVRNAAIQALFDLDKNIFSEILNIFVDKETKGLCNFLKCCNSLSSGEFNIAELGILREEVFKYLPECIEESSTTEQESEFIKDCRPIILTGKNADFEISVIKKIFINQAILEFTFVNKLDGVTINSALLSIEDNMGNIKNISLDDIGGKGSKIIREIEVDVNENNVFNSIFEYQILVDDELDEDSISLEPFNFTVLDFVRPIQVTNDLINAKRKNIQISLNFNPSEAATKIIGLANMFLIADKGSFTLSGSYKGDLIFIEVFTKGNTTTTVSMNIYCNNETLVSQITDLFE